MIKSHFIRSIVYHSIAAVYYEENLLKQMMFIEDADYNYTGEGVFVSFSGDEEFTKYPIKNLELINIGYLHIDSPKLAKTGADAMLVVKKGYITHLEIWAYGLDYPREDLTTFTLTGPNYKILYQPNS